MAERGLLDDVNAEVARRFVPKPQPPPGFNPLAESDGKLREFGLVPPPRPSENPEMHLLWRQALSPPMQIRAVLLEDLMVDTSYRLTGPDGAAEGYADSFSLSGGSRFSGSANWSGATVAANQARRFTAICAAWTVPTPGPPLDAAGAVADGDYRVVSWIGLDGNFLRSKSLPQAGTSQRVFVKQGVADTTYSVWFQWWVRGQFFPPLTFNPAKYPVAAEHEIVCLLFVDAGSNRVTLLMANLTKQWALPLVFCGSNSAMAPVEGSTAGWIVERPQSFVQPLPFYTLADYGQVVFRHCATASAHEPPSLGHAGSLRDARRVRMRVDLAGPPHRSAIISRPHKLGLHSVQTRYRNPF